MATVPSINYLGKFKGERQPLKREPSAAHEGPTKKGD